MKSVDRITVTTIACVTWTKISYCVLSVGIFLIFDRLNNIINWTKLKIKTNRKIILSGLTNIYIFVWYRGLL